MAGLLARPTDYQPAAPSASEPRYHRVVYLASPAARSIVDRASAALPGTQRSRLVVRDLPVGAVL